MNDKAAEDRARLREFMQNDPVLMAAAQQDLDEQLAARAARKAQAKLDAEAPFVIHQAAGLPPPAKPVKKQYKLKPFAEVAYEAPHFLFNPYILQNAITIIQGDTGVGKTAFICKLAAAVSIGGLMQDVQCEEGNTLICSVEDDPSTLRGRIEASGGDLSRCFFPEDGFDLTFMSEQIEDLINEIHAKMVIFDPLQAFLGAKVDMHRANETRPVMARLAEIAKRCNCAVVIVSHLSKGSAGGPALYRALGSIDIVAASRSVLYVGRNPRDPSQCAVVHAKHSHSSKGRSFLYRIGGRGGVQWEGYTDLTEKDLETQGTANGTPSTYEDDPLVQFLQRVVEENPEGVFLTWASFNRYAMDAVGKHFGSDGREIKARIGAVVTDLARRDGIYVAYKDSAREKAHIECGVQVDFDSKARGVFIERREQAEEVVF
jgi:hypothetical protein